MGISVRPTRILGIIAIVTLMLVAIVSSIFFNSSEKSYPVFQNGDMVVHTLSGREGQVIDNKYTFNSKSDCWKVKLRFKSDIDKADTIGSKISKLIDDTPLTFNEFELEKK